MSRLLHNLELGLDEDLEEKLSLLAPDWGHYHILRQSVDARRAQPVHFVYSVEVFAKNETPPQPLAPLEKITHRGPRPVIIGAGPAGLFAALRFVERGVPCVLLERGSEAKQRLVHINRFWRYGEFHPDDNVCFGEGGAGLYSDGKLITRIKSPHIPYIMNRLVKFGAPAEIEYMANPHVGSDRIRRVIPKLREFLLQNGCEIRFNHRLNDLVFADSQSGYQLTAAVTNHGETIPTSHLILATGHSAEDIYELLHRHGVVLEGKSFAMGLRIEHPQKFIDQTQYREQAGHPKLGAANYKITHHDKRTDIGVYSFCMCPGGYVLSSGTARDGIVCNGMSNYHRNSPFANSAIAVTVDYKSWFGEDVFAGLHYQRELEKNAFAQVQSAGGKHHLPVQKITDFLQRRLGESGPSSSPSGVVATRLDQLLPEKLYAPLVEALSDFESKMRGFVSSEAQFHGIETRTSSPIRITRNKDSLESVSHRGLYPVGEGAGYAGGITSAAADGIRAAEVILNQLSSAAVSTTASVTASSATTGSGL